MHKQLSLGLDFDGAVANTGALKALAAKRMFGADLPIELCNKKDIIGRGILSDEQYRMLQSNIYGTREYANLMEPVDGMLEILPRLIAEGHNVTIITNRTNNHLDVAREWLARKRILVNFVGVEHGKDKSQEAVLSRCDIFVDDDAHKLIPMSGLIPNLFLFSWPYNMRQNTGLPIDRISSWHQLYQEITKIKEKRK